MHITPKQLGNLRHDDPEGIAFIERNIIYEAEERHKAIKDAESKAKSGKGRRKR